MLWAMISVCETSITRCVYFLFAPSFIDFSKEERGTQIRKIVCQPGGIIGSLVHVVECNIVTIGVLDGGIGEKGVGYGEGSQGIISM